MVHLASPVVVPGILVGQEERCLRALRHIDPLSSEYDGDHGISCYERVTQILHDITIYLLFYIHI